MSWNVSDRRHFLKQAAVAGALSLSSFSCSAAEPAKPKLKLAVKYGMVKGNASIEEKFALLKKIGFAGVELDSTIGHQSR